MSSESSPDAASRLPSPTSEPAAPTPAPPRAPPPPIGGAPRNYTPHAILGGSVVIAIGLYLGLRRDPAPLPAPSASTPAPVASPGASLGSTTPTVLTPGATLTTPTPVTSNTPVVAPSARVQADVDADVAKAVESLKQRVVRECWAPRKAEPGMPAKVKFVYSGSFDPAGVEVARGISEDRVASSPKVAACLREFKMDLAIPAPGAYVNVNVPFEVP